MFTKLKISSNNEITIHPIKTKFNKEDMFNFMDYFEKRKSNWVGSREEIRDIIFEEYFNKTF